MLHTVYKIHNLAEHNIDFPKTLQVLSDQSQVLLPIILSVEYAFNRLWEYKNILRVITLLSHTNFYYFVSFKAV